MTSNHFPLLRNRSLYPILLSLLLIVQLIPGCDFRKEPLLSKDEAEIKFIRLCKDEYDLDAHTKLIGNTFWIYIPYQQDLLKFKANRFASAASNFTVDYLNGEYEQEIFRFEYQIKPLLKSEENKGYTYSLTDELSEQLRNLLNLIYRVYFNSQEQPEFYRLVMADIVNGVEIVYTIYGLDLKKAYNNAIASEEYYKRILQDIKGGMSIINDRTGRHLNYQETNFGEFLTRQIVQRIRIKFLAGGFKTEDTTEQEILKIISYCLKVYEFKNYWEVILKNLSTGKQTTKSRIDLLEIKEL